MWILDSSQKGNSNPKLHILQGAPHSCLPISSSNNMHSEHASRFRAGDDSSAEQRAISVSQLITVRIADTSYLYSPIEAAEFRYCGYWLTTAADLANQADQSLAERSRKSAL